MTLDGSLSGATAATDVRHAWRIVLLDRQRIFRLALRALLAKEEGFDVVGDTAEPAEALRLIESLQPDVVVSELHLNEGAGVQHIAEIHARFPAVAILVLTASRAYDVAAQVRKAGALGYLTKEQGPGELRLALRAVATGRPYRNDTPRICVGRTPPPADSLSTRASCLTQRQREVLRALARGHGTREIAAQLGVSVKAVHKLRDRLCHTLQLQGTAALTRFAVHEGFAE